MMGAVTSELEPHRPLLRDLAYRITGDAGDAEDIVQEAFVRALRSPPVDRSRPLRPWLVRVTANLARDALRRRRRRPYDGPWLPSPVEVEALTSPEPGPEARVERREQVGWAALVALEHLTPQQRAVLVLRDVAELTPEEVAEALGSNATAVRATHARARRALAAATPEEPARLDDATVAALGRIGQALAAGDLELLRSALLDEVTFVSDGGGQYLAARRVLHGADRVARFLLGLMRKVGVERTALVRVNDRLALWSTPARKDRRRLAPRSVMLAVLAPDGRIASLHLVAAGAKLAAVGDH